MCALTHSHMSLDSSINVTTHCNTLQHAATHCNILHTWCVCQNSPKVVQRVCYIGMDQHTATHCNTLQHTATYCIALQHTATHCKPGVYARTRQRCCGQSAWLEWGLWHVALTAVCCSVLQCVVQWDAVCCSVLQWAAVCCSLLDWNGVYDMLHQLQCVVQCVVQWDAVCCSELHCVAACLIGMGSMTCCTNCSVLQCVAVRCRVVQWVAMCCSPRG